jgi:hypothetical protein
MESDGIRQEMIRLLRAQMETLDASPVLSDEDLAACYQRQEKVRELRDRLSNASAAVELAT